MILDENLLFWNDQAITASPTNSTAIDLSDIDKEAGQAVRIYCAKSGSADFNNLTSLEVKVQTDSSSGFSSPTDLQSASLTLAEINNGAIFPLGILTGDLDGYVRLVATVSGTNPTTGALTAGLVLDTQTNT